MDRELFARLVAQKESECLYEAELERLLEAYPWFALLKVLLLKSYHGNPQKKQQEVMLYKNMASSLLSYNYYNYLSQLSRDASRRFMQGKNFEDAQIIDAFIEKKIGRIKPDDTVNYNVDISRSQQLDDSVVSESLAKIFVMQGHFEMAIDVYRKLILKYPKKNTYFASAIDDLQLRLSVAEGRVSSLGADLSSGVDVTGIDNLEPMESAGVCGNGLYKLNTRGMGGVELKEPLELLCGVIEPNSSYNDRY